MDIDEFLDMRTPIRKRIIPASTLDVQRLEPLDNTQILDRRKRAGTHFSQSLKEQQDKQLVEKFKQVTVSTGFTSAVDTTDCESVSCDFESVSCATAVDDEKLKTQLELYGRYPFNQPPANLNLPIHAYRSEILHHIRKSPVLVIRGETGCGKSTQVPQFLLDEAYVRKEICNIVVTQPRRIAAISLSEQVARERGIDKNTLVAYQIGLDRKVNEDTRLTYCTTGVLLEKLILAKRMDMYTHIILDEIHERDEDMEFLLIAIKRYLIENPFMTKIILMSATIDTDQFAKYFRLPCPTGGFLDAPTLELRAKRQYPIHTFYLDHLVEIEDLLRSIDYEKPGIDLPIYRMACTIVASFSKPEFTADGVCFLLFLPGIHEIAQMARTLEAERERSSNTNPQIRSWHIMPLHSIISSEEQRNVFIRARPNTVKIILATNIAESSITVPDVKYVIDFCLTRTLEVDSETGFSMLRLKWASKNSCVQRSGRAGRTSEGRCYRLISKSFFNHLQNNETSALMRCSLEKIVLKAKKLDDDVAPSKIIGLAIEPPDLTDIETAVLNLKETRGLHFNVGQRYVKDDGDLTFIGQIMESLPLDIRATRLIVMGYMFNVLDECIIIAAGLTVQKVFTMDFQNTMKTYTQKLIFADGSASDLFAILHAYQHMIRKIQNSNLVLDEYQRTFAARQSLDLKGIYEMFHLVDEIKKRLLPFKLQSADGVDRIGLSPMNKNIILKVCFAGAFYPNYYLRASCISAEERERQIFHDLNGRDPTNTVFYRGIGNEEMGILYVDQVKNFLHRKDIIKDRNDITVSFDEGSSKMYVTFLDKHDTTDQRTYKESLPGNIKTEIYKAIKLTREHQGLRIKILDRNEMHEYAQQVGLGHYENRIFVPTNVKPKPFAIQLCLLPGLNERDILGQITNIRTPNKFWIKPSNDQNEKLTKIIQQALKKEKLRPVIDFDNIIGKKVAVKVPEDGCYYRSRVLSKVVKNGVVHYRVFLFDEGSEKIVLDSDIKSMDGIIVNERIPGLSVGNAVPLAEIPPRGFQGTLAEVRPSHLKSSSGKWISDAINRFKSFTEEVVLIEIFSVWNGVASVILYDGKGASINKLLVDEDYGESCEECYPSKYDHVLRYNAKHFTVESNETDEGYQETFDYLKQFQYEPVKPPSESRCTKTVFLKGPVSPLETTVYATIRSASTKALTIERFSVNSVLLDTDPQDPTDRLVVAASCSSNTAQNSLLLRNTTVMPNIRGFGALMALIFAPSVELHPDSTNSRFNSILCGLGYNPKTKQAFFAEHDLIMNLDCLIDKEDLILINKIRYTMSSMLYTNMGDSVPNLPPDTITSLKKTLISDVIKFLQKKRSLLDIRPHVQTEHKWGLTPTEQLSYVSATNIYGDRAMFPGFSFKHLKKESEKEKLAYRLNNQELHAAAFCHKSMTGPEIQCLLCSKTLISVPEIRIHLFTKLHQDRTVQYDAQFEVENFMPESKTMTNDTTYFSDY